MRQLEDSELNQFEKKIITFLLESNAIEEVYDMQSLHDAWDAWWFLTRENKLSLKNIQKAHGILMRNRPLANKYKGSFRDCNVFIGGRKAIAPFLIENMMNLWLKNHGNPHNWEDIKKSHIAFEYVHPFADGNGRIGRIIMNQQCMRAEMIDIKIIHEGEDQYNYYKWFNEK